MPTAHTPFDPLLSRCCSTGARVKIRPLALLQLLSASFLTSGGYTNYDFEEASQFRGGLKVKGAGSSGLEAYYLAKGLVPSKYH